MKPEHQEMFDLLPLAAAGGLDPAEPLLRRESRNRIHLERFSCCNQTGDKSNNYEENAYDHEGRCICRCYIEQ
jgi:hypothetical protein